MTPRPGKGPARGPHPLARFARDRSGAFLIAFAVALPVLLGAVSAAVEYSRLLYRKAQLQSAADSGVLAGANMLKLANADDTAVTSITRQAIEAQARTPADRRSLIGAEVGDGRRSVSTVVEETVPSLMGKLLSLPSTTIVVRATAQLVGSFRLCLLALDNSAKGALDLEKRAQVTAEGCTLYSNSRSASGIQGKDSATARALSICSAGGFDGSKALFTPAPITDCTPIDDPLKDRPLPTPDYDCVILSPSANPGRKMPPPGPIDMVTGVVTLDPGTYCGGLRITESAIVTLRPGTYVMKDGPLIVDKKASLSGQGVAFYFTGSKGGMLFDKDTAVSLTAPTSGLMAGLLIAESRTVFDPVPVPIDTYITPPPPPPPGGAKPMREYRILSDNTRTMLGTIYLPAGRLIVDSSRPVADQSAYTVIVARQINLYEGPNLHLNANYGATSVPVPEGVGPRPGAATLRN
ncbi:MULTISPECIES: TadE/TadG family type IV pilus assembly protein [Methylobacterium]|uniref:TadE/TadG family type IV pilus assembly protein n=1 Tax=Methylobacterium TaxID=407 RepID=UPI0008F3D7E7|nr:MULTISPECIES: TadE/TadG family type IV pilus assembly protein [Methylobacterium]MBZ6414561.1 pilus assembly protein [Methylobacterium sp.]MBK3399196.1 pilus assembly protein [Methylobacterium ajmalii]MBK3410732.1 pilus assembly protein [Methylobacterium ajmalii]MBK3425663.1 pilus assembly protein [Methylobacterium ajmalii]SFF47204.1 Putative Flp pilus-assembly TadE/G-like [Methylobacterium sp. yr596]